jgi:hypothetical protein
MPLSWTEIRQRAIAFARHWSDPSGASRERAEAQTFWNEFFDIFGIRRRTVASFEEPVKNLKGQYEFIDLFWKGKLIAEHKSRGKDLSRAQTQAHEYVQLLASSARQDECPRYIVVSDFARLALHDLEAEKPEDQTIAFDLRDLPDHIRAFAFIAGYETRRLDPEDPANIKAVELLANLHDLLEEGGYNGHDLQRFMVRVLFCLFAEDTGIFEPQAFNDSVLRQTRSDGSDLGPHLAHFFAILNTPLDKRQRNLPDDLAALPYVNGQLFAEHLRFPEFNSAMRTALLQCCNFKWQSISPAIFGSLFQGVMDPKERRQIGGHYTSEPNILKLVRSLFLDDLRAELAALKHDKKKLAEFHRKLGQLKFFDPACGCGNFLVIAYRELRRLEMDVLQARFGKDLTEADIRAECRCNVSQMYGIEIQEWPVRIAEVALWLIDHQLNTELFERFGQPRASMPLAKSPHIHHGNALRIDWNRVIPKGECSYILGNPPFVGKKEQTAAQKADMHLLWKGVKGAGLLDYVTCWYLQAGMYMRGTTIRGAFVSTNSITQGEQAATFWPELRRRCDLHISFAHTTFAWQSEARGMAHVHVVIVGFSPREAPRKTLFLYEDIRGHPHAVPARNINAYLDDAPDVIVRSRSRPMCDVPAMSYGSMMIDKERENGDDDGLVLSPAHRTAILAETPGLAPFIRRLYGGNEFLNGIERWCLWLVDAPPELVQSSRLVRARLEGVRRFRKGSHRAQTRKLARTPGLFGEIRQPDTPYLLVPKVSSERRDYIPIGFVSPDIIASGSTLIVPGATMYHFGVLSSEMHNAWMRRVAGRMKSDFQYSSSLVYNNFPWPQTPTERQKAKVEACAKAVLDARAAFPTSTLAVLYDPIAMPAQLASAHADLDRAVDACYRPAPFDNDRQRVEFLFALYAKLAAPLMPAAGRRGRAAPRA